MRKTLLVAVLFLILSLFLATAMFAQSDSFTMSLWNISAGAGKSSVESFNPLQPSIFLTGQIANMDTTLPLQTDGFELRSGFPVAILPVDRTLFLPVISNPEETPVRPGPGPALPTRQP